MANGNNKMEMALAALLVIVIIMSGVSVYYSSVMVATLNDISSKQDQYYAEIIEAITGLNVTPKPTLNVFALWSDAEGYNFRQVLGNFSEQTGINVTYYSYTTQDLLVSMPIQLRSGTSIADVILAPWPAWILDLAPYLTSVNDIITESDYPTNIIGPVKDSNDAIWGAPFKLAGKPGFWYKKSFFAAHSLTVPTTYDEFVNTLLPAIQAIGGIEAAIASGDTDGWPLSDQTEGFIMGLGGYQLQEQLIAGPSQRNWTDPQVRSVFVNMSRLLDAGYFSVPAGWADPQITKFWNEQYGLYWMGSWMTGMPQIGNVSDLDFFGFPGTDGVVGSVDYAIMPKTAPHSTEAKQLVEYLSGAEAQEIWVRLGGFFGTNLNVNASAYKPLDKKVADFMGEAGIHIVADIDDSIGGNWQTLFWNQLKTLWTAPSPRETTTLDSVLDTLQTAAIQQQS
jgi:multiple sugar transport system substrate-binding protein